MEIYFHLGSPALSLFPIKKIICLSLVLNQSVSVLWHLVWAVCCSAVKSKSFFFSLRFLFIYFYFYKDALVLSLPPFIFHLSFIFCFHYFISLLSSYSLSPSLLSPALFHCLVVTVSALLYPFLFYLHICPFLHPCIQHTALIFFLLPPCSLSLHQCTANRHRAFRQLWSAGLHVKCGWVFKKLNQIHFLRKSKLTPNLHYSSVFFFYNFVQGSYFPLCPVFMLS